MQEYSEEIAIPDFQISKSYTNRSEVKELVKYIDKLRPYEADYTANKWREIVAKPSSFIGFGRLGDWYQYVLQQKKKLELLARLKLDKKISPFVELSDNISISASELSPHDLDWEDNDDMEREPHFHEKEMNFELKINVKDKGHVSINVYTNYWRRYFEGPDSKIGDSGKIEVVVTTSTVTKLQKFVGLCVLAHDVTDCTYTDLTPDVPIKLNLAFFKDLSSLLGVSDASLVKLILDTCQYPFMKCDWKKSMPKTKLDILKTATSFEHIHNEIAAHVPSAVQIFKKGYMRYKNHLKVLDYLLDFLLAKVRNSHCKLMTLYALLDNTCYDFSDAFKLILERTYWHTLSWCDMAIADDNNQHEFSVQVKLVEERVYGDEELYLQIIVTNVASSNVKEKILAVFELDEDNGQLSDFREEFYIRFSRDCIYNVDEEFLEQLAKLMRLDWYIDQLWKFLHELVDSKDELPEDHVPELYFYNYTLAGLDNAEEDRDSHTATEEDAIDEFGSTADAMMQLYDELNDITTDVDPFFLELQQKFDEARKKYRYMKFTRNTNRKLAAPPAPASDEEVFTYNGYQHVRFKSIRDLKL